MSKEDFVVALFKEGNPAPTTPQSTMDVAALEEPLLPDDSGSHGVGRATPRRSSLTGRVGVVAALVVVLSLVGLGALLEPDLREMELAVPSPSPESISGVYFSHSNWILEIGLDGTMRSGTNPDRRPLVDQDLISSGTYTLDGDILTFTSDGEGICPAGTKATMRVSRIPWGELSVTEVSDDNECWVAFSGAFIVSDRFRGTWRPVS